MNDSKHQGLIHKGSVPGSPADKAGMKPGDVIIAVNGVAVSNFDDYLNATETRKNPMTLDILRNGRYLEVSIVLPENPIVSNHAVTVMQLQAAGYLPGTTEEDN